MLYAALLHGLCCTEPCAVLYGIISRIVQTAVSSPSSVGDFRSRVVGLWLVGLAVLTDRSCA